MQASCASSAASRVFTPLGLSRLQSTSRCSEFKDREAIKESGLYGLQRARVRSFTTTSIFANFSVTPFVDWPALRFACTHLAHPPTPLDTIQQHPSNVCSQCAHPSALFTVARQCALVCWASVGLCWIVLECVGWWHVPPLFKRNQQHPTNSNITQHRPTLTTTPLEHVDELLCIVLDGSNVVP